MRSPGPCSACCSCSGPTRATIAGGRPASRLDLPMIVARSDPDPGLPHFRVTRPPWVRVSKRILPPLRLRALRKDDGESFGTLRLMPLRPHELGQDGVDRGRGKGLAPD